MCLLLVFWQSTAHYGLCQRWQKPNETLTKSFGNLSGAGIKDPGGGCSRNHRLKRPWPPSPSMWIFQLNFINKIRAKSSLYLKGAQDMALPGLPSDPACKQQLRESLALLSLRRCPLFVTSPWQRSRSLRSPASWHHHRAPSRLTSTYSGPQCLCHIYRMGWVISSSLVLRM